VGEPFPCELAYRLLAKAQLGDERAVALYLGPAQITQESSPLPHQFEEATPGVVIFTVDLQVLRELANALSEESYLHL